MNTAVIYYLRLAFIHVRISFSILSFEMGQSLDCFAVVTGAEPKIVCATHGSRTEILVYNFPQKEKIKTIHVPDKNAIGLISITQDFKRMVTISKIGPSYLGYWNLATGELLTETPVAEGCTFMSFNPFNQQQLVTGQSKALTIWNISSNTSFQKPVLVSSEVSIDISSKIERQVLAHQWVEDGRLLVSSPTGELLQCIIPSKKGKDLKQKGGEVVPSHYQLLSLALPSSTSDTSEDANEEEKLTLTVVASRLPFAYEEEGDEGSDDVDGVAQNRGLRRGRWGMNKGAVVYSMAVTKTHLVVGTEDGSVLWLNSSTYRVIRLHRFDKVTDSLAAISYVEFVPSYKAFVTMNMRGRLSITKISGNVAGIDSDFKSEGPKFHDIALNTFPPAIGFRTGKAIKYGLTVLAPQPGQGPSSDSKLVAYGSHGSVYVWSALNRDLIGSYSFKSPITCLNTSPDGNVLVVGLKSGLVCMLDASQNFVLRLVSARRLHNGPVIGVAFNSSGDMLASLGTDSVYFIRGADFKVLGYVAHKSFVQSTQGTRQTTASAVEAAGQSTEDENPSGNRALSMAWVGHDGQPDPTKGHRLAISTSVGQLIVFDCPTPQHEVTSTLALNEKSLNLCQTDVGVACLKLVPSKFKGESNLLYVHGEDKVLKTYIVDKKNACAVKDEYPKVHSMAGADVDMSVCGLVASVGTDGQIVLYDSTLKEVVLSKPVHNFAVGGATSIAVSTDGHFVFSSGADGGLFCWDISSITAPKRQPLVRKTPVTTQADVLKGLQTIDEPSSKCQLFLDTFIEQQKARATSDEGQTALRDQLFKSLSAFKSTFKELMQRNEEGSDIERLGLQEFAIDLEQRDKLLREEEEKVNKTREAITITYKGKELIAEKVKEQCWDSMNVKGMMFTSFKSGQEVHNFPLRNPSPEEASRTAKIHHLRKMQILESRWIESSREHDEDAKDFDAAKYTQDCDYVVNGHEKDSTIEDSAVTDKKMQEKGEESGKKSDSKKSSAKDTSTEKPKDDAPETLLYHPFACTTTVRRRTQAFLMASRIEEIKAEFNKEFLVFYGGKEREIDVINEKAKRIKEICQELRVDQVIPKYELMPEEIPDSVLRLDLSEIKAEKVLSLEEQEIMRKKQEEARIRAMDADDGPERALDDMMNGTLEVKRDLSLLEKDLVREEWMDLPAEQMTEKQQLDYAQFLKKVEQIKAEQETRRKLLQTELMKLKNDVAEVCRNFDDKVSNLAEKRVSVLRGLFRDELMIIRLMNELVREERQVEEEKAIAARLVELESARTKSTSSLTDFKKVLDNFSKNLEVMQAEEKQVDRSFKREFADAGDYVDYLYKLFKRRGKAAERASVVDKTDSLDAEGEEKKDKQKELGESLVSAPAEESLNPFAANQARDAAQINYYEPNASEMPDDMDPEIWVRFVARRSQHIEKEMEVKKAVGDLAEMHKHLSYLQAIDNAVAAEIKTLKAKRNELIAHASKSRLDMELMLRIRQGQVEIEESPVVTDLKDIEMIEKHFVEDVNTDIKKLGPCLLRRLLVLCVFLCACVFLVRKCMYFCLGIDVRLCLFLSLIFR